MANKHRLPGELTIYAVGQARSLFQGWVAKLPKGRRATALEGTPLAVDGASVNEVDAAGAQMLLSLSRSLAARRRTLRLEHPSQPLQLACETLGLTALLAPATAEGPRA